MIQTIDILRKSHALHALCCVLTVASLWGCTRPTVPDSYHTEASMPRIMPDYTGVTIPANICPLNFKVLEPGRNAVARLSAGTLSYTYGDGMKVMIDETEWAELRDAARGGDIKVEVFVGDGTEWKAYQPFSIHVADDEIDRYIAYRLIQPSYVAYNHLRLAQRDITSWEENVFYDNSILSTESEGQCVNCHSFQNYSTDHMLFHLRQEHAGTMIVDDGKIHKVDLKTAETISPGVYPAWHPSLDLVAFSTNATGQVFHTKDVAKVEVQDTESCLILYDADKNTVTTIADDPDELETFPAWSADGNSLYYCSAHFEYGNDDMHEDEMIMLYRDVKYNIYAMDFDRKTRQFGQRRLVFAADSIGKSATLPRISPDGRRMVFALGSHGCFHVWHDDADIYMMDLQDGSVESLDSLNSDRSESYPSFSSNSRWIMTASRRDDGNYTRPYIAYIDKEGICHKAFELPQRDPNHYLYMLYSYNRPEFTIDAVGYTAEQFAKEALKESSKATYVNKRKQD